MNRELLKRLQALERDAATRCVLWIDAPEGGLHGWEVVPMKTGGAARIWRDGDEADDALQSRAAAEANRHQGVVVAYAMDAQGMTR